MIAVWNNGRTHSDRALVFVEVGDNIRTMTHVVGLLRLFDGYGMQEQGVVAIAKEMTFLEPLRSVSIVQWIHDVLEYSNRDLIDGYNPADLERLLAAIPDVLLEAANIWNVPGIKERIAHRKRQP